VRSPLRGFCRFDKLSHVYYPRCSAKNWCVFSTQCQIWSETDYPMQAVGRLSSIGNTMISRLKQCGSWLMRVTTWLADAHRLWVAVLPVPVVFLLSWLTIPSWESRIRVAGLCLQLMGLATVAYGLRDTRKLFNQPSFLALAREWLRRFPTFRRAVRIVTGTGHIQLSGASVSGFGTVSPSPTATLEERVAALEKNLSQANFLIHQTQERIEEETRKQNAALASERGDREAGDENTRKLLQEATAGGLYLEATGVLWLFIGITLSTASIEIARLFTGP
jgi:hypothetical protein